MNRPHHEQLDTLTYTEFGAQCYMVNHDSSKPLGPRDILEIHCHGQPQQCIHTYEDGHITVSRIQVVYPHHSDVFYLRLLLLHRPASSWIDIRTVDGTIYNTHQDTAWVLGLLEDANEGMLAFQEMISYAVFPMQLRWLFCVLAVEGDACTTLIWEQYENRMSKDIKDDLL